MKTAEPVPNGKGTNNLWWTTLVFICALDHSIIYSVLQSGIEHRNGNMAHLLARKVSGLRKSVDIAKYIETVPVISYRFSTCNTSQHSWEPVEKETHTGQKWEKNDYRLARFVGRPK